MRYPNRIDSVTFFAHEFGHALAFNGWYATATGSLPGDYISTYDYYCRFSDGQWFFHGPQTTYLWGAPLLGRRFGWRSSPRKGRRSNSLAGAVFLGPDFSCRSQSGSQNTFTHEKSGLAIARDCGVALSPHRTFAGPGRVAIEPMVDGVPRLIWDSIPLGNYAVEYRDALTETWRALGAANFLTSPPGTVRIEDLSPVLPRYRYYRVRLHP